MKILGHINFLGVLALASLCAVQWSTNSRVNKEAVRLEFVRLNQQHQIDEQEKSIKGYASDLEDLRRRLGDANSALQESEGKLAVVTSDRDKVALERDRANASLEKTRATLQQWMAAVAQRDESIKKANAEITKLATDRNDAVARFNDLAGKYNGVVKDYNALSGKR